MSIIVHGGLKISKRRISGETIRELEKALDIGVQNLRSGSALDAVVEAVAYMEDSPYFNAGVGSSLNLEGLAELDASVMDGSTLRYGGVGAVGNVKNPVRLARLIMEKTEHSLIVGEGAEKLAAKYGLKESFETPIHVKHIYKSLLEELKSGGGYEYLKWLRRFLEHGTVGAVALDRDGNIAAATSTGGLWLKLPGRVGDTPTPGCGTYADNRAGGCSGSGIGEAGMRLCMAKRVVDLLSRGYNAWQACRIAVEEAGSKLHLKFGVIALDKKGNPGYHHNGYAFYIAYHKGGKKFIGAVGREGKPIHGLDK